MNIISAVRIIGTEAIFALRLRKARGERGRATVLCPQQPEGGLVS
ncbi:hypothetical protein PhaeoP97_03694 (plasmid) [Phaeobacter porticola]|uniref:Uncharacterized protein n=1 Tax=Phaeobacter porticola TaxID=1844006 RepID=A0A1L3IAE2_9RHOB|nr:hypothetical protein PhaeoP97_03694 [Phaeobacter porticola]